MYYKLSSSPYYYLPRDGPMKLYKDFINAMPATDHPEAFGQHPNADVASQIQESKALFDNLLAVLPQKASATGEKEVENEVTDELTKHAYGHNYFIRTLISFVSQVAKVAGEMLKAMPRLINTEALRKYMAIDTSPLTVVLLQEVWFSICFPTLVDEPHDAFIGRAIQRPTEKYQQCFAGSVEEYWRIGGHVCGAWRTFPMYLSRTATTYVATRKRRPLYNWDVHWSLLELPIVETTSGLVSRSTTTIAVFQRLGRKPTSAHHLLDLCFCLSNCVSHRRASTYGSSRPSLSLSAKLLLQVISNISRSRRFRSINFLGSSKLTKPKTNTFRMQMMVSMLRVYS